MLTHPHTHKHIYTHTHKVGIGIVESGSDSIKDSFCTSEEAIEIEGRAVYVLFLRIQTFSLITFNSDGKLTVQLKLSSKTTE